MRQKISLTSSDLCSPGRSTVQNRTVDIFQDGFADRMESTINDCQYYLILFPESVDSSLLFPDSPEIEIDSLFLSSDSTETQIYSDSLYQTLPTEKEDIIP